MGIIMKLDTEVFSDKKFGNTFTYSDSYIEYLQGDGDSYIDTGFTGYRVKDYDVEGTIPSDVPKIELTFSTDYKEKQPLFGLANETALSCEIYNDVINIVGKGARGVFDGNDLTIKKVLEYGSVYSYIDGVQVADNSGMSNQYRLNAFAMPIILFGGFVYVSGVKQLSLGTMKIYEFKAYLGDTLTLHLKPYVDEYGVVCMKDVLTETLYYNKGNGTFIGGNIIN